MPVRVTLDAFSGREDSIIGLAGADAEGVLARLKPRSRRASAVPFPDPIPAKQ